MQRSTLATPFVKFFKQNLALSIAFVISMLAHAALLAVHFVSPDLLRSKPTDPGLEVILVNAKHDKAPLHAEALAQANLDGGGNADEGRAKSPLPDMQRSEDGDNVKVAKRHVEELEEQQRKLMAQIDRKVPFDVPMQEMQGRPDAQPPQPKGMDLIDSAKEIARREAEISKSIEDYNKRPKKTQITPNTKRVEYAMYYKTLQERIEKIGTLNFPQQNGRKLYGELIVYIPIFQDGTIYEKEGGPRVERSSGNPALDRAALRIVRRSAPFARFPSNMRTGDKDDVWEIITRFKFTREDALEAELHGGMDQ
jgi:periplasmic protein TonB